jgi:drug/metabolite transporter (DMT)-like permease
LIPYALFQVAALLGAIGQALYKVSADRKRRQAPESHRVPMLAGIVVYCGALALFVWAFSFGGRVGSLYATYSTTFLWSMIIGRLFWGESFSLNKVVGVLLVMGGVCLVTLT